MKILHVIPSLTRERGGPTTAVEALSRRQAALGHAVAILTTDQGVRHHESLVHVDPSVELKIVSVLGPDRWAYAPAFVRSLRSFLEHVDIVHAHSIFNYPIHVCLREASQSKVPLVLRPCGMLSHYSLRSSGWKKRLYLRIGGTMMRRACTAWHYTSEREAADSWPWNFRRQMVVPNGIEPADFAMERGEAIRYLREKWPRIANAPYVLFLGRLHPKKRPELLLQAFLAGAPSHYRLVFVGPDACNLWNELESRFLTDKKIAERVMHIDMVNGRDKTAILTGASLFALPSEHENFGIAALESLASGTPVLLSFHVDFADAAVSAGFGFSAPLNLESWRQQLAKLLADPDHLAKIGRQARSWAAAHFAWDRIAATVVEKYQWTLDGCPPQTSDEPPAVCVAATRG